MTRSAALVIASRPPRPSVRGAPGARRRSRCSPCSVTTDGRAASHGSAIRLATSPCRCRRSARRVARARRGWRTAMLNAARAAERLPLSSNTSNVNPSRPASTSMYVCAPAPACGRTCTTRWVIRGRSSRSRLPCARSRPGHVRASPRARAVACCTHTRRASRRAAPRRLVDRDDRGGEVLRLRGSGDDAVLAVGDQSAAALSGSRDDDARGAVRRRLDHDQSVPLAPRGQQQAERPAESRPDDLAPWDEAGHLDDGAEAVLMTRRSTSPARARRRRSAPRSSGIRARAAAIAADDGRRALLGDVTSGEDDERLRGARAADGRTRRRAPHVLAGEHRRPRRAGPRRRSRAACSREKQKARWGTRTQSTWTSQPEPRPTRPR